MFCNYLFLFIKSSNLDAANAEISKRVLVSSYPGYILTNANGYIKPNRWGFYKNPETGEKSLMLFDDNGFVGRIIFDQ